MYTGKVGRQRDPWKNGVLKSEIMNFHVNEYNFAGPSSRIDVGASDERVRGREP